MIIFCICLCLLVAAYFSYGKVLEKIVHINHKAPVPSRTKADGVDYVPLPKWKTFLIQLLNIAGIGPIFGAISGFHATQSPLMSRCVKNENECRFVFYGAMISESIIALIWAAIAMAFFGGVDGLNAAMAEHDAPWVVNTISRNTLGLVGGILAVLGVVVAPITSGDTAFRAARLTIADALHIKQKKVVKRLMISAPLFAVALVLLFIDFDIVWRYFSWSNQVMAAAMLWCIYSYLEKSKYNYWIALIPAVFMTYICTSFVFVSNQFLGLGARPLSYILAGGSTILITFFEVYFLWKRHSRKRSSYWKHR